MLRLLIFYDLQYLERRCFNFVDEYYRGPIALIVFCWKRYIWKEEFHTLSVDILEGILLYLSAGKYIFEIF